DQLQVSAHPKVDPVAASMRNGPASSGGDDRLDKGSLIAVNYNTCETARVVPHLLSLVEEISANNFGGGINIRSRQIFIDPDLLSALSSIAFCLVTAYGAIIHNDKVKMNLRSILLQYLQMNAGTVPVGLSRLRHEITDIDLQRRSFTDGSGHACDQ